MSSNPSPPDPTGPFTTVDAVIVSNTGEITQDFLADRHHPVDRAASGSSNRYQVLRRHAEGGMGQVMVALDLELNREVAFKEIKPGLAAQGNAARRFVLEAEVTGRLEHPGIVPVYSLGASPDGRPFYAMRFIEGESLRDAIKHFHAADKSGRDATEKSLSLRGLLRRFIDVCNAVAFAHSKGYLHRDLKPANVMLGSYGETLVVDWGLAKVVGQKVEAIEGTDPIGDETLSDQTRIGQVAGTPGYMAPEQAEGRWDIVGPASDVYSLGATLYFLLTGQAPYSGSVREVLARTSRNEFPPPRRVKSAVPAALEAVVLKAMRDKPEDRYPTSQALATDIEHWLADEPVGAYREPWWDRLRRWGRRNRTLVTSLAALVLTATVALAVGLVLVNQEKNQRREAEQQTRMALYQVTEEQGKTQQALIAESAALERSQQAERTAGEQRQLALKTVRSTVEDIDARLKDKPALQELRKALLTRALEGLKEVARSADTATQIDRSQFSAHIELGDVFAQIEVGGTANALAQYERALALAQQLHSASPDDTVVQQDLSICFDRLGTIHRKLGNLDQALTHFTESLTITRRMAATSPNDAPAQRALSTSLSRLGNVDLIRGDTRAAAEHYQDSLAINRRLAATGSPQPLADLDVAIALEKLGDVEMRRGVEGKPLLFYEENLAILRRLTEADSINLVMQRGLAVALSKCGDVYFRRKDWDKTLEVYLESRTVTRRLVEADPANARAQRDQAITLNKLGDLKSQMRKPAEALEVYKEALAINRRLAEADTVNAQAQRDLALTSKNLGDAYYQMDESTQAEVHYRSAMEISRKLLEGDPSNTFVLRDLLLALSRLGDLAKDQHDYDSAGPWYEQALAETNRAARPELVRDWVEKMQVQVSLCRAVIQVAANPTEARNLAMPLRDQALTRAMDSLIRKMKPEQAVAVAEMIVSVKPSAMMTYHAGRGYALCADLATKPEVKESSACRAVALLRLAVKDGLEDPNQMKTDDDLDSLRKREDFRALLRELESR